MVPERQPCEFVAIQRQITATERPGSHAESAASVNQSQSLSVDGESKFAIARPARGFGTHLEFRREPLQKFDRLQNSHHECFAARAFLMVQRTAGVANNAMQVIR